LKTERPQIFLELLQNMDSQIY